MKGMIIEMSKDEDKYKRDKGIIENEVNTRRDKYKDDL